MSVANSKLDGTAEGIRILAKEAGAAIGVPRGTEAVTVLEQALAMAWVDVLLFQGADSPARMQDCVEQMTIRVGNAMRLQHYLRRGHKPS